MIFSLRTKNFLFGDFWLAKTKPLIFQTEEND